jgi:hypothetical protein
LRRFCLGVAKSRKGQKKGHCVVAPLEQGYKIAFCIMARKYYLRSGVVAAVYIWMDLATIICDAF